MRTANLFLALTIAILIAIPGAAQEKKKRKSRAGAISPTAQAMVKMMKIGSVLKSMDLSADQQEQLKKMREEAAPAMKELFEKMGEILTDDQKQAAEAATKKAREEGKEGRQFAAAVEAAIKPTDEQKEKMAKFAPEINKQQREMLKGIRSILTAEQQEVFKKKMAPTRKKKPAKKKEG